MRIEVGTIINGFRVESIEIRKNIITEVWETLVTFEGGETLKSTHVIELVSK